MAANAHTTGTTALAPSGGFPPFRIETFENQIFWLAITFSFLFIVLWRVAGPRIGGAIATRKGRIAGDFAQAEAHRKDAEAAHAAYETALAQARKRAQSLAEENRKRVQAEIDAAKAAAEASAQSAMAAAEASIHAVRQSALATVAKTAEAAAIAIVAHLTGETVSAQDAAAAVAAVN
jgi:F-type H+-transporting ATPase subunit b